MRLWRSIVFVAVTLLVPIASRPLAAQDARADTAAILLAAAERLAEEGERELAADLLRFVLRAYPDTPAAPAARQLLADLARAGDVGGGRVQFVVANTLIGGWLGVAIPAALSANGPTAFGAGILAGPTIGLFGSLAYTRSHPIGSGQAAAYLYSFLWASWQAFGWREVLDIGERESCTPFACFTSTPDEAPWRALVLGGLGGLAVGGVLAGRGIPAGDAALVWDGALWGTWYGIVGAVLADAEDDDLLTWMLLGGDALLLLAIPAARATHPSVARVRMTTIAGLAGGLVGAGLDLLLDVDDENTAILLPAIGSAAGLAMGWALGARGREARDATTLPGTALFQWHDGPRLGIPLPRPQAVRGLGPGGQLVTRAGLRVTLFALRHE